MSRPSATRARRTLAVDVLARVEGEGGLEVKVRRGALESVRLNIYEPPRLFEAFLRGRDFREAPDFTARICGICPVAYQTCAAQAMERACGVTVPPAVRDLRRLLYCGEWIESHALHVVMLHAPDFLGYESGIHMAKDHPEAVTRGLGIKKVGNAIMTAVGGREIHPVNMRVGGFWRAPAAAAVKGLRDRVAWALEESLELLRWVATFTFPDVRRDWVFVALRDPERYPVEQGRIVTSAGHDLDPSEFERHFGEEHVHRSNALHGVMHGHGPYHVGPLARWALNQDRLTPAVLEAARAAGLAPVERNPFRSILVRAAEMAYACEEALRLIDAYQPFDPPAVEVTPRDATGWGVSEAPRGLLWHSYSMDGRGVIRKARIVPPTAQNQKSIESDVAAYVERHLSLENDALQWGCEQAVRNYDPCISCATHFMRLSIERV
uniref:Ni/Fe hydrogenase subunit alpha n=1 Tax=Eiseniibacteriota bacterium TaxID=2212470 RepID=A0A832I0D4_UNCEI